MTVISIIGSIIAFVVNVAIIIAVFRMAKDLRRIADSNDLILSRIQYILKAANRIAGIA